MFGVLRGSNAIVGQRSPALAGRRSSDLGCLAAGPHSRCHTFDSESGEGTTFHVYLPRIEHVKEMHAVEAEKRLPTGHERILFIDDEQVVVDIGKQMLERLGYEVITRTGGYEALEVFSTQPERFDLIITDQTMPHMTGEKLARKFLSIRQDIPIILCTGFSEMMTPEKASAMGIKEILMKPIVIRDLANTIRNVLEGG